MINTTGKLASFCAFLSPLAPFLRVHWPQFSRHSPLATRHSPLATRHYLLRPSPAGSCLPPTSGLTKIERSTISTIGLSLFSMSPNRAIRSDRSSFLGRSPVGAPGRVGGGHFRRAQPSQFAHGCAPTDKRHQGDFLVERNSFRFSVPLVPFERANRSAGKKRKEFRSTAPKPRVLGKGQSWLKVAHQLVSAHELFSPLAAAQPWGGRATHFPAPK